MTTDPDQAREPPGELFVRFEPPDLIFVVAAGEVTSAMVSAAYDEIDRIAVEHERLFAIADARRLPSVSFSARKAAMDRGNRFLFRGSAIVGASAPVQAVLSFLVRAFTLVDPRFRRSPLRFFSTEEEARAWIAERRAVLDKG